LSDQLEALDAIEEERALDAEERELQALLPHLCTEYEDRTVKPPKSTPLDALRFLMDQNGLRPVDMTDVFGSRAVVAQVLNGKREISKEHARRLAGRFRLSVEAFISETSRYVSYVRLAVGVLLDRVTQTGFVPVARNVRQLVQHVAAVVERNATDSRRLVAVGQLVKL
jgi:HTH-type transcriptional regulator/antitoxin HigA